MTFSEADPGQILAFYLAIIALTIPLWQTVRRAMPKRRRHR